MAEKQINELTGASSLDDATVFPIEQDSGGWFTFKATLLQLYAYIVSKLSAAGALVPDPSGAGEGAVVTLQSGSPAWAPVPNDLPTGGTTGQALVKTSGTNYAVGWFSVQSPLPTTTNSGWVLTQQSATPGDADWSALPDAGLTYRQTLSAVRRK